METVTRPCPVVHAPAGKTGVDPTLVISTEQSGRLGPPSLTISPSSPRFSAGTWLGPGEVAGLGPGGTALT